MKCKNYEYNDNMKNHLICKSIDKKYVKSISTLIL